ncbi:unnamed protein product, partial [Prorocentrum cordatum]
PGCRSSAAFPATTARGRPPATSSTCRRSTSPTSTTTRRRSALFETRIPEWPRAQGQHTPHPLLVSQFRFLMIHTAWNQQNCTADVMNQALLEDLTAAKKENPYIADCHYLPQSTFVHGINPNTVA